MTVTWICHDCGTKHGHYRAHTSTYHSGKCDVCKEEDLPVTEGRDYGVYTQPKGIKPCK